MGKLSVATPQNKKARLAMFERRKKNLLKKASELSTLCDVDTCVIIFPPPDSGNHKVETFPEDPTDVIKRYQGYDAKKQKKKNYDLIEFFKDRKNQVKSETSNLLCPTWNDSFNNMGEDQLRMFVSALDCKILECNQRIGLLLKEKESDLPVVQMGCSMQSDSGLEIPFSLLSSSHDVLEETHLDFMSTLDSEFQEGSDQMEYFDDLIMGSPLVTLPNISNQNHFSFLQNTPLEDNNWSNEPLADGSSHGLIESHCLQDKVFHYGLEILI